MILRYAREQPRILNYLQLSTHEQEAGDNYFNSGSLQVLKS